LNNQPDPTAPLPSDDFIVLGTIVRPHGLKGEVKVSLACSGIDRLKTCPGLRLIKEGRELKKVSVIRSFMHPDGDAILRLKEVVGVDEAESLRGAFLAVPASEREVLAPDAYFLDDLVGLSVVNALGEEIGRIEEVLENPGNDVIVVRKGDREILVPALKSLIREVDLKTRRMVVELPEEVDADTAD